METTDNTESSVSDEPTLSFDFGKKKKKTAPKEQPSNTENIIEQNISLSEEPPYTYDELLKKIYNVIDPEKETEKERVPAPSLLREGNRRTIIVNFPIYCSAFKRSALHLSEFFYAELSCVGSIDGMGRLNLKAKLNNESARVLLKKYISNYVKCSACKSSKTSLVRINRLNTMICEECGARKTVDEIKAYRITKN